MWMKGRVTSVPTDGVTAWACLLSGSTGVRRVIRPSKPGGSDAVIPKPLRVVVTARVPRVAWCRDTARGHRERSRNPSGAGR